jgi:hypothetical protein
VLPHRAGLAVGIAVLAAVGFCGIAAAQSPQAHVLTIRLPGGGIEQIQYTSKVAPRVFVSDVPAPMFTALTPRLSASRQRWIARPTRCSAMPRRWRTTQPS